MDVSRGLEVEGATTVQNEPFKEMDPDAENFFIDGKWIIAPIQSGIPSVWDPGMPRYSIVRYGWQIKGRHKDPTKLLATYKDRPVSRLYLPDMREIKNLKWHWLLTRLRLIYFLTGTIILFLVLFLPAGYIDDAPVYSVTLFKGASIPLIMQSGDSARTTELFLWLAMIIQAVFFMLIQRKLYLFFRTAYSSVIRVSTAGVLIYLANALWVHAVYGATVVPWIFVGTAAFWAVGGFLEARYLKKRQNYFYVPPLVILNLNQKDC